MSACKMQNHQFAKCRTDFWTAGLQLSMTSKYKKNSVITNSEEGTDQLVLKRKKKKMPSAAIPQMAT